MPVFKFVYIVRTYFTEWMSNNKMPSARTLQRLSDGESVVPAEWQKGVLIDLEPFRYCGINPRSLPIFNDHIINGICCYQRTSLEHPYSRTMDNRYDCVHVSCDV